MKTTVLEPSFGDGSFLDAVIKRFDSLGEGTHSITGIELQTEPFEKYIEANNSIKGYNMDFMKFDSKERYDAVIGNPPYISIKNLNPTEKNTAESTPNFV